MRQAVRVGCQIRLPRIRSPGKTGMQSVAAESSTNDWAVGGQRLWTFCFKRFVTLGWQHAESWALYLSPQSTWTKSLLQLRWTWGWRVCQQLPDCQLANPDRCTGEIALPRELGALDGPVLGDVCVEGCRTVVCRAQDRAGEVNGYPRQLGDRGCARTCLLVRMGGVHTACDWPGQTVPVDGAEVCTSHSDPHHHVAHHGSPGSCHRIFTEQRTSAVRLSHN